MTAMLCAAMAQTVLLLAGTDVKTAETYAEAREVAIETGKPMVVMVSTDWCSPCQVMKKSILPRVREHGLFRKVAFAVVNPDRDGKLAEEITGGGPVPQLVMFRKTPRGWIRKKLVGGQSVEAVEEFINDGLASKESDRDSSDKTEQENARNERVTAQEPAADLSEKIRHG